MSVRLLDVSVLLALIDPRHIHHGPAHRWFERTGSAAWATCPITENGLIRIISHPTYVNRTDDAPAAMRLLDVWCSTEGHRFWPADVSIRDALTVGVSYTHNHLTDLYLLALAVHHEGTFATLDRRISPSLVIGGPDAMVIVPT